MKYVKRNFLPTRTFTDLADLNTQARRRAPQIVHSALRIAAMTSR